MNALWIRVEANEKASRRVWAIRRALGGVPAPHVVGYLTCLGGEIAQHAPDGNLSEVDDELLEMWAMWDGEPGAFAAAFRAACAPDGEFLDWSESMGELVRRREKDRQRKRGPSLETPSGATATTSDVPRNSTDVPRNSGVRNVTVRDDTTTATAATQARTELLDLLPEAYEPDLDGLLARVPAQSHHSWLRSLLALTSGLHPPGAGLPKAVPPASLGEAIRQFNTNGETNWKRFTGYVRDVLTPRAAPAAGSGGGGRGGGNRTEQAAAAGRQTYETVLRVAGAMRDQAGTPEAATAGTAVTPLARRVAP